MFGKRFLYHRTKAFQGAYRKGWEAAQQGATAIQNPYDFFDSCDGGPTYARAFHRAWEDGWNDYQERKEPNK